MMTSLIRNSPATPDGLSDSAGRAVDITGEWYRVGPAVAAGHTGRIAAAATATPMMIMSCFIPHLRLTEPAGLPGASGSA